MVFRSLKSSLFNNYKWEKRIFEKIVSVVKVWYIICIPCSIIECFQGNCIEKILTLFKNVKLIEIPQFSIPSYNPVCSCSKSNSLKSFSLEVRLIVPVIVRLVLDRLKFFMKRWIKGLLINIISVVNIGSYKLFV